MSYEPGDKSVDPKLHFEAGMKDFSRLDYVRLINIWGTIQYGVLYSVMYFIIGITLHVIFPPLIKGEPLFNLFLWILLQSVIIMILTFYTQKLVESIPSLLSFFYKGHLEELSKLKVKGWLPYGVSEYKGDMASSLVLIGTQVRLLEKIGYFTTEFAKRYI
jgi:hypothetical protein